MILSLARPEKNPPQLDRAISLVSFERLFRLNFVNPQHLTTVWWLFALTIDANLGVNAKLWVLNLRLFALPLEL